MLKLWCSGVNGTCDTAAGSHQQRFHITCLWCRFRRRFYAKMTEPTHWILYTYLSWWATNDVREYVQNGKVYSRADGGWLRVSHSYTLKIDPRGKWTGLRCAAIIWIDKVMLRFGTKYTKVTRNTKGEVTHRGRAHGMRKPWAEICEFLSNYPK